MPTRPQATPQTSGPPVPPPLPGATVVTSGGDGKTITIQLPKTDAQVFALVSRRDQLSSQMENAMDRRQEIVAQIREAPDGVSRTGLEQQVALLDDRILSMEKELANTEAQLAQSPADLITIAERDSKPRETSDRPEILAMTGLIAIATLVVYKSLRRLLVRRPPSNPHQAVLTSDATVRLERLERGIESIAIEIERISEGQRFVTKLMAEGTPSRQLDRAE